MARLKINRSEGFSNTAAEVPGKLGHDGRRRRKQCGKGAMLVSSRHGRPLQICSMVLPKVAESATQ